MEDQVQQNVGEASTQMDINEAVKRALKSAYYADGLSRGLHEAAKTLDKVAGHFCVLAESCDEPMYVKLVEALCHEHSIPLIKVNNKAILGEWVGQCKYDKDGKARKVVGCSCAVVKDYGRDEEAAKVLRDYFATQKKMAN
uniref:40S ribosomal protein S12 n=2 Tax=Strongyloides TaxID=6247 RepID=A0A0K0F897_STRVS